MNPVPAARSGSSRPMSTTLAMTITQELRRMIQSGELPAGTPLRQVELAERFGVSTTPVREALTALAREGVIRHDAHRGAVVFPPSHEDIRENFEIRLALEPLASGLAAGHLPDTELVALEELAAELQETVAEDEDPTMLDRYERLDRAFHSRIFAAARRPRLASMIESLRDAFAAYAHLYEPGAGPDLLPALQAQHAQLIAALQRGDAVAASKIAADHVWLTGSRHGFTPGAAAHLAQVPPTRAPHPNSPT